MSNFCSAPSASAVSCPLCGILSPVVSCPLWCPFLSVVSCPPLWCPVPLCVLSLLWCHPLCGVLSPVVFLPCCILSPLQTGPLSLSELRLSLLLSFLVCGRTLSFESESQASCSPGVELSRTPSVTLISSYLLEAHSLGACVRLWSLAGCTECSWRPPSSRSGGGEALLGRAVQTVGPQGRVHLLPNLSPPSVPTPHTGE